MSRFNTAGHKTQPAAARSTSPLTTVSQVPDTRTFEGGPGWTFTPKAELFRLATGALLDGKGSFYESGAGQDERLRGLVTKVALEDPQWGLDFATWLRGEGNIRTAALVFAADFVKARLDEQKRLSVIPGPAAVGVKGDVRINRRIIATVCRRPDEPGELLAYWMASYGRAIPKPVKRGLADAVRRMYNERAVLKYDTASHAYRFGDVLNLIHVAPREQKPLFELRTTHRADLCPRSSTKALATFAQARRRAEWVTEREGISFRPNACECGWFHITKKPKDVRVKGEVDRRTHEAHRTPTYPATTQGDLFKYALDRRHNPGTAVAPDSLPVIQANRTLMALPVGDRRKYVLDQSLITSPGGLGGAGITWEMLAGWLQGPMDKAVWEAMIPNMGIMALIRNLRNFDQAGVSDKVAQQIVDQLVDSEQIARSRQFPFRFLAAYQATAGSLRWAYPLEQALNHSLSNVPVLGGRTLVLVDRSGSMFGGISEKSGLNRADSAAIFGTALALRAADADLVQFGSSSRQVRVQKGEAVLKILERFTDLGGTDTVGAVRAHFRGHDRVVIITDEQAAFNYYGDPTAQVPADVPVYTWNLAGYRAGHAPSGKANRHNFGGLTDAAFRAIPLVEAGQRAAWPWEQGA